MPEVSVVIPTMNEEASIGAVIDEVRSALVDWDLEILIVDTDSRDRTRDIAIAKGARVVPEPQRGYGRAYKTGFAAATGTFVATLDADLTYPASRFPDFLAALAEDRADFVSGDRLSGLPDGAMTGMHRVGNEIPNIAFRSLYDSGGRGSKLPSTYWFNALWMPGSRSETMSCHASQCSIDFQVHAPSRSRWCGPWSSHVTRTVPNSIASSYTRRARRTDSSFGIASSSPFRSRRGYWIRSAVSPSAAASDAFVLSIVRKNTPLRKSIPRRNALNWSRIIESAFTIVRPSGDRCSCSGFVGPTTRTLRPW